jgi:hypothetical protein
MIAFKRQTTITIFLSALVGKKFGRIWNKKDFPKPAGRTATTSNPFSMCSKHLNWSGFKQNEGKRPTFNALWSRCCTWNFS